MFAVENPQTQSIKHSARSWLRALFHLQGHPMRRVFFLLFSLAGLGVLLSLGIWQVQRLAWKNAILATIETRIAADPVALPQMLDPEVDKYRPVSVEGIVQAPMLRVLTSRKGIGAGYRIISPLQIGDRVVLLDRGFVPQTQDPPAGHAAPVTVTGNIHWPDETDSYTPAPDLDKNIWFARDVTAMAAALGTEPAMIVLRDPTFDDGPVTPLPVDTASIANDHLQYAITWFSLALIWAAMTLFFLRRSRAKPES